MFIDEICDVYLHGICAYDVQRRLDSPSLSIEVTGLAVIGLVAMTGLVVIGLVAMTGLVVIGSVN